MHPGGSNVELFLQRRATRRCGRTLRFTRRDFFLWDMASGAADRGYLLDAEREARVGRWRYAIFPTFFRHLWVKKYRGSMHKSWLFSRRKRSCRCFPVGYGFPRESTRSAGRAHVGRCDWLVGVVFQLEQRRTRIFAERTARCEKLQEWRLVVVFPFAGPTNYARTALLDLMARNHSLSVSDPSDTLNPCYEEGSGAPPAPLAPVDKQTPIAL